LNVTFFCVILPIIIIVAIVVIMQQQRAAVDRAYGTYQEALQQLKANPTSADLRRQALDLGRAYSNLTRNKKGVTVYDEMALMNDIGAATAGAGAKSTPVAAAPVSTTSVEDRLKRLDELRNKGVINDQEWSERRQKILSEI
jgi:hypothetical protein